MNKKEFLLLILFVFIILALQTLIYNTIDMDYWARLLQGNAFWELGHILKQDPFSYTQTHTWLDHEWGSSVIFSFIQNNFGFNGILIFRILIVTSIFALIFATIKLQTGKNNHFLNIAYFLFAMAAMPTIVQSGLRCHFFTFLFFTLFIYILELVRKKEKNRLLVLLPIIMLFWSNIHGGCVSGLGLLGLYIVGEFLNKNKWKKYLLTLVCSLAVMFINPYGFDFVKFIFMASTMERPFVTEWISAFAHPNPQFLIEFKILFCINFALILLNLKKLRTDYTKLFILVACAFLSFKYIKNTPFFIIVSFMFLYECIVDVFKKKLPINQEKIITAILVILTLFFTGKTCREYLQYSFLSEQPLRVVEFLSANELKGKIISPFDMGSYISYKLYPDILIYMDGRYEEVYPKELKDDLDNFYNVQGKWDKVLETNPDYIIVPTDATLNDNLLNKNEYKLIYRNETNSLYSHISKLKDSYSLPTNNIDYYHANAFKTKFTFKDEIIINGEKVIFK
ncbi:MAG: hypothetical protein IJY61_06680 [Candidatus Gastranaerophilales bacterium]|nr:hypothetical protein [Candidatus Gastranaerophilales bacterium]